MKVRAAIAFGVLAATTLLVVLICVSPDQAVVRTPPALLPPQPVPTRTAESTDPQPAAAGPVDSVPRPLPTEEELAAMDERIRQAVERLPAWDRLTWWYRSGGTEMSESDYAKARALYLRFLDSFTRVTSARFRVERYESLEDGSQRLQFSKDVYWAGSSSSCKERVEGTYYEEGGGVLRQVTVWDGRTFLKWNDGELVERGKRYDGYGDFFLRRYEMAGSREHKPFYLNYYTNCEIDDGSSGVSRIWGRDGIELRFDTATGLLSEDCRSEYRRHLYTYQKVNGVWFPLEQAVEYQTEGPSGHRNRVETRVVFSQVALNGQVDEALFDVNKPF